VKYLAGACGAVGVYGSMFTELGWKTPMFYGRAVPQNSERVVGCAGSPSNSGLKRAAAEYGQTLYHGTWEGGDGGEQRQAPLSPSLGFYLYPSPSRPSSLPLSPTLTLAHPLELKTKPTKQTAQIPARTTSVASDPAGLRSFPGVGGLRCHRPRSGYPPTYRNVRHQSSGGTHPPTEKYDIP
jgi:hypothetical protein